MKYQMIMLSLIVAFMSSSAHAATTTVTPAFCNALIKHTPDADVAYQAGVDVDGKRVAPADLPDQQQIKMPTKIQIPLTANLARTLNLNTTTYPYDQLGQGTEATLGVLTVDGDKVLFNDQEISTAQQDKLAVLCLHSK